MAEWIIVFRFGIGAKAGFDDDRFSFGRSFANLGTKCFSNSLEPGAPGGQILSLIPVM
jgi:hypothetical protein